MTRLRSGPNECIPGYVAGSSRCPAFARPTCHSDRSTSHKFLDHGPHLDDLGILLLCMTHLRTSSTPKDMQNSVTHTQRHKSALNKLPGQAHVKKVSDGLACVTVVAPPSQPVLSGLLAPVQPCFCLRQIRSSSGSVVRSADT